MVDERQVRMLRGIRKDHLPGVVRRAIIDADDLIFGFGDILRVQTVDTAGDISADIITWKDERKLRFHTQFPVNNSFR